MKAKLAIILKGMGMGAANVIPGVSGGTIALITGIFERLIAAIKSFDIEALQLLLKGEIKLLLKKVDFEFLVLLFSGIAVSILSLAKILDYLFIEHSIMIWSYFFGLILASIFFVIKTIKNWSLSTLISLIIGTVIAATIAMGVPASPNAAIYYLLICGAVATCSMILPGLSGSFVLVLMGNYQLIMIDAINNRDLAIIIPVGIGAILGLILFSRMLSWILKKYHDQTIGVLTGFIAGSLLTLWPWKEKVFQLNDPTILTGYHWAIPNIQSTEFLLAMIFIVVGILTIYFTERVAK